MHKTEERLRRKGVKHFRFVPPKLGLPLLQNATMEDDDDLHSLWSALLAAAMDPAADEVHRKYVSILADLTGPDAAVLRKVWTDWQTVEKKETFGSKTVRYGPGVQGTDGHAETSVITLNRLGLIAPNYTEIRTYYPTGYDNRHVEFAEGDSAQVYGDLLIVVVTPLGEAFCRAVMTDDR